MPVRIQLSMRASSARVPAGSTKPARRSGRTGGAQPTWAAGDAVDQHGLAAEQAGGGMTLEQIERRRKKPGMMKSSAAAK